MAKTAHLEIQTPCVLLSSPSSPPSDRDVCFCSEVSPPPISCHPSPLGHRVVNNLFALSSSSLSSSSSWPLPGVSSYSHDLLFISGCPGVCPAKPDSPASPPNPSPPTLPSLTFPTTVISFFLSFFFLLCTKPQRSLISRSRRGTWHFRSFRGCGGWGWGRAQAAWTQTPLMTGACLPGPPSSRQCASGVPGPPPHVHKPYLLS